jgi:hypothetical protein
VSSQGKPPPDANVEIRDKDGKRLGQAEVLRPDTTITVVKANGRTGPRKVNGSHAEEILDAVLQRDKVPPADVRRVHSELNFCRLPGHNCRASIPIRYPNATFTYNETYDDGTDGNARAASRQKGVQGLALAVGNWRAQVRAAGRLVTRSREMATRAPSWTS